MGAQAILAQGCGQAALIYFAYNSIRTRFLFFSRMKAYRPGQGLNKEALERLRERRHANDGVADLPAPDSSKQWDRLLGEGARKKPRCGICTRPVSDEETGMPLLCSACAEAHVAKDSMCKRDMSSQPAKERSPTPSTNADSEEMDCNSVNALLRQKVDEEATAQRYAAVSKGLEGEWLGNDGKSYWVEAYNQEQWTCLTQQKYQSTKVPLLYDERCQTIWWGHRGGYFVDISAVCSCPTQITWSQFDTSRTHKQDFPWHRPEAPVLPQSKQQTRRRLQSTVAAQNWENLETSATQEVLEQLYTPGNEGFVWIDSWNERYLRHLGTLRCFLEGHPDTFTVIPLKGKAFRVAPANKASHRRSW